MPWEKCDDCDISGRVAFEYDLASAMRVTTYSAKSTEHNSSKLINRCCNIQFRTRCIPDRLAHRRLGIREVGRELDLFGILQQPDSYGLWQASGLSLMASIESLLG